MGKFKHYQNLFNVRYILGGFRSLILCTFVKLLILYNIWKPFDLIWLLLASKSTLINGTFKLSTLSLSKTQSTYLRCCSNMGEKILTLLLYNQKIFGFISPIIGSIKLWKVALKVLIPIVKTSHFYSPIGAVSAIYS